jgi:arsenate reductase-like glutaredoxin family protein
MISRCRFENQAIVWMKKAGTTYEIVTYSEDMLDEVKYRSILIRAVAVMMRLCLKKG